MPFSTIVAAPKRDMLWRGVAGIRAERLELRADGGFKTPEAIHARPWPERGAAAMVSRSHADPATEAFLSRLGPVARNASGSSVKFCRLAEGTADVYPRLAPTSEWDIAAGHALLTAAGGAVFLCSWQPTHESRSSGWSVDQLRIVCTA